MYRTEARIGSSAVGRDGRLRLANAVDSMQNCSYFDLADAPTLSRYFAKNHCGMYLLYRQVNVVRRPRYGERVSLKIWAFQFDRTIGRRITILWDETGDVAMVDYEIGAFIDLERNIMVSAPQKVVDALPL